MVGYTRQSAGSITDGATIQASHFNDEYNQIEAAFAAATGHDHSGGAGLSQEINLSGGSIGVTGTLAVGKGGIGVTTLTDGGVLLGSGTSAVTAMGVLADGSVIVGDGATDPVAITAFTSSTGLLIHERGGIELDISAITTDNFLVGTSSGVIGVRTAAQTKTHLGLGTADSPQFTGIELGAASDTTLTRSGAGDMNIEGNIVYRASGTDVPVADGGTGVSTLTAGGVLLGSGTLGITATSSLADGDMIVGDGVGDPAIESGATLRTSIGVGTGNTVEFANLFINETANAGVTVGLTINQGANDDEILALKSSDIAHAMTDRTETDTYGTMRKDDGASGGLGVTGYRDADGTGHKALVLIGRLGEAAITTDTTASSGVVDITAQVTDGAADVTNLEDDGNLLAIRNHTTCRLLLKGNGTLHATNITAGSGDLDGVSLADHYDDVGLIRVHQRTIYNDVGVAMSKWDETINAEKYRKDLVRLGVLSSQGDFTCLQRMDSLLGGAIWQLHTRLMETQERLAITERKLLGLPAH